MMRSEWARALHSTPSYTTQHNTHHRQHIIFDTEMTQHLSNTTLITGQHMSITGRIFDTEMTTQH